MWRNSFFMSTGRRNTLAGQIAEHLVCAELAKRDLLTTTFSGNVPQFDVLATDASCRTVPIQVKASRGSKWPSNAKIWMDIELDPETGTQIYQGPAQLPIPELVYVCVSLEEAGSQKRDHFFILTMEDLQKICIQRYTNWMGPKEWKRPRNPASFDLRYEIADLLPFEDNWALVKQLLHK
jgi:hypothetical protein